MAKLKIIGEWILSIVERGIVSRVKYGYFPYTGSAEI